MRPGTAPPATRLLGTVRGVAVLTSGLLAGAVTAGWLGQESLGASAALYTGYRQATDPGLSRVLPPLGGLALLTALATGFLPRPGRPLALGAVACLVGSLA